ncbi:hypothetical protein RJ639_027227 [Escallonia herrerae]|uniref:Endonuclease/exonuclease/phosphatase domain-containing protein n=1 Tax=Escallonia herrerae TaxID=1293975 RepID=A0AA88X489_9ASTE|nr:hypothetical protein RJ639_027227 [Escallonia herrerae]
MAGLYSSSRPTPSSSSKILLLLTALPLTLAAFAFVLQWRGGLNDPTTRWSPDRMEFPGMGSSGPARSSSSSSDCVDLLGQSRSASFPYFRDWKFGYGSDPKPKVSQIRIGSELFCFIFIGSFLDLVSGFVSIFGQDVDVRICITTSTSAGLEQTLPWIFYHKVLGVATFYLFVEGKAASPGVSKILESIPGVHVIYRTRELEEQQAKRCTSSATWVAIFDNDKPYSESSRIWNETWLAGFFYKPCNYELFVKQSLNMEMAIVMAREAGMDWIIHLDTDELLHPAGAREYSLRQLLSEVPANVDMVVFPNYESSVERDDIKDPFGEVSMFKKNYDHLPKDTYFGNYKEATRGNPNYFLTYGNGKSVARIQDHLRPNGAHRWHNYMKTPNEIKLDEAAVLHYTYPKFSDLTSRRKRCGCKPTKEDVKRCFMLEFDRAAFIIASTATEEEMLRWYREHVVWTDKALNLKLLKKGILTRIYAPMAIIQGLRQSGVFGSVITSAQTSLSKDNFLSSIESGNTTSAVDSQVISSRKIGNTGEFQSSARKVLELADADSLAIPPLSPPEMDNIHLDFCSDSEELEGWGCVCLLLHAMSLGVPATGRKSDLVSALKSFLNREIDGKDHLAVEDGSMENNSKRKAKGLSSEGEGENISSLLEVSGHKRIQRTRTIVNQVPVEDSVAKVETTIAEPKKKPSVKTGEITEWSDAALRWITFSGRKSTWARSAEIVSADYRVDPAKNEVEPWTILAHKKPQKGWIAYNPRTEASSSYPRYQLCQVNVLECQRVKSFAEVGGNDEPLRTIQEPKERDVEAIKESLLEGYENSFWTCSSAKLGYSGTAIISRIKPLSVKYGLGISDHDSEGRLVTVEFDSYYIVNGYVPNAGDGLRRLSYRVTEWDPSLGSYIKDLEKSKPVILTGDLNCAHEEIDIYDPTGNKRSAGFTAEERQSFETNFLNRGFVDTFRKQHPGVVGYTYWGYRHNGRKTNKGWRLDYFLVSESIADNVHNSYILPDVTGSDHSPIGLILKL